MRKWILGLAVAAAALMAAPLAYAHAGHAHKVTGTVSSVEGNHLTVKTADGKTVMVMLDAKTKVTQGTTKLDAGALKVGDRVVAEGPEDKQMIMATTVRVGAATATAKK